MAKFMVGDQVILNSARSLGHSPYAYEILAIGDSNYFVKKIKSQYTDLSGELTQPIVYLDLAFKHIPTARTVTGYTNVYEDLYSNNLFFGAKIFRTEAAAKSAVNASKRIATIPVSFTEEIE